MLPNLARSWEKTKRFSVQTSTITNSVHPREAEKDLEIVPLIEDGLDQSDRQVSTGSSVEKVKQRHSII